MSTNIRDRSDLETEDGISDGSMRKAQQIVDAAVAQGARLALRQEDFGPTLVQWIATLSVGSGHEQFTVIVPGLTQRLAIWKLAMDLLSEYYPRFMTREQIEAAIEGP